MTTTPTPADLARIDPAYWASMNKIRLVSGTFSFDDRGYQLEPMQSRVKRMCYMKATQGGFSEIEILKSLHGLIYRRYPQGVLYLFPTTDNVLDFSKSRFAPLIQENPAAIGRHMRRQKKGTDAAGLKRVGPAFLYLRGARLDVEHESVQLRSIPVDRVILDELDLMSEEVIAKARGRMGSSRLQEEVFIGNPTLPDFGIDKVFQSSDQRHLFRKCSCGASTCAELSFPGCVKVRDDGTGYIACDKCGKPVGIEDTEWVPAVRENSNFMHGYRWSQLSGVFNDPAEILEQFNEPPQGNLGDIYRLRLGLPYAALEDKLSVGVVMACCGGELMPTSHEGPCAMGVDIGKMKHVVIGLRTGRDRFEILRVAQVGNWTDIHDLARKYNVKNAVIDIWPYEEAARSFQDSETYRIYLCAYAENRVQGVAYNDLDGMVRCNRTEICDATHQVISEKRLVLPRQCPEIDVFAAQCCHTAKVLEENKRTGTAIYRYRKVGGEDHYRHALNYFLLAASKSRAVSPGRSGRRQTVARNNFALAHP